MTVRVSVVVPTYRRPDLLERCLSALSAQDFEASAYEIIIADDAADDATRRQIAEHAARTQVSIRYLAVERAHGPAAARNAGWRAARGSIVAFTDDDCVPDPGWLRALVTAMSAGAAAASGKIRMPIPRVPTDYERNESGLEHHAEFVTANCACRREVLAAVGGFDERFTMAWREDSDLHFTLIEAGFSIVRAPDAIVLHPVRSAPWGVSLKQQRKSVFNALLYKKHRALYRAKIQPGPPWGYYATAAGLLLVLAGILGKNHSAALAGGALWLLLTARFCLRRLAGTSRAPAHVLEMALTSAVIPMLSIFWRLRGAVRFRVPFF